MPPIYSDNGPETEHSAKYSTVLKFFKEGFWDEAKVRDAVSKGFITKSEFSSITGETY